MLSLACGIPLTTLLVSYAYLAIKLRAWNLFPVITHESGCYTLLQTIFYFSHFARELPICLFLAGALWAAFAGIATKTTGHEAKGLPRRLLWWLLIAYLFATAAGAVIAVGWQEWFWNLAQYRRRDEWFEFGSHWAYHFWHIVHFAIAAWGLALVVRGWQGHRCQDLHVRMWPGVLWVLLFILACVIWRVDGRVNEDPLYLAHQLREIVAHFLLTLPLGAVAWLWTERQIGLPTQTRPWTPRTGTVACGFTVLMVSGAVPLLLYLGIVDRDIASLASRDESLTFLFFSHNFEHVLDYIAVMLLAVSIALLDAHGHRPS